MSRVHGLHQPAFAEGAFQRWAFRMSLSGLWPPSQRIALTHRRHLWSPTPAQALPRQNMDNQKPTLTSLSHWRLHRPPILQTRNWNSLLAVSVDLQRGRMSHEPHTTGASTAKATQWICGSGGVSPWSHLVSPWFRCIHLSSLSCFFLGWLAYHRLLGLYL